METEIKKKAGRPVTKKQTTVVKKDVVVVTEIVEKVTPIPKVKTKQKIRIPADTLVSCRSGVRGELKYISRRMNGMQYIWNDFGDENSIEYEELSSLRNTDMRFFKDNWIVFEDSDEYTAQEIYESLKVDQYYKNMISIDNFDSLFNDEPENIIRIVSGMTNGLKETVSIRAKQLYNTGILDSRKRIEAIESSLGIELIKKGS